MFDQKEPEFNFSGINNTINKIRKFIPFPKNNLFFSFVILIALLVLWLASGFFTVQPGEQAALRFFGKFNTIQGPGLHWF